MTTGKLMTFEELYFYTKKELMKLGNVDEINPSEAYLLLNKIFGFSREQLYNSFKSSVPLDKIEDFEKLLERRMNGEPLQYLLGEWEFYGLPFKVGPGVLIPRPETEELVDYVLPMLTDKPNPTLLDLCSGTGCIPITIAHLLPSVLAYGVELSPVALDFFIQNISLNNANTVTPLNDDVLNLKTSFKVKFDVITSNPPYIASDVLATLQKEVQHEPAMALDGGNDGLIFYRIIAKEYKKYLKPNGWIVFEIGNDQGTSVFDILTKNGYDAVSIKQDLSGNNRLAIGQNIP